VRQLIRATAKKDATSMSDLKELRRNAQDCLTQVRNATNADDKVLWLNIAYAWLKLGEQVEQLRASRVNAR
jgi:hypothetical protein